MKKVCYMGAVLAMLAAVTGCSSFLDRLPEDRIVDQDFWTVPNDVKIYANQFYPAFPSHGGYSGGLFWSDNDSDNMTPGTYNQRLAGQNTLNDSGDWSFYNHIRSVNYGLERIHTVQGDPNERDMYVGELLFFRAFFYFQLVRQYGDVPWHAQSLNIDAEELFKPRSPRTTVVDSILQDLTTAISYLPVRGSAALNRLNKECALLFKSRVALYEGTWQKYHEGTVFATPGADWRSYLETAADAAYTLVELGTASLFQPVNPENYYADLFGAKDYATNPEILLYKKHSEALGQSHFLQRYMFSGGNTGVSKSLVDDFLCADGLPIANSGLYSGDEKLTDVIADRDPRLRQMLWAPGDPVEMNNGEITAVFTVPDLAVSGEHRSVSGYQLKKGKTVDMESGSFDLETASILFRYAEVLLNYAEAKAELGTITQDDVDLSINKIRLRARMPDLIIATIAPDPHWLHKDISPLLNEIRRERRIELACEGFRFDDLARWAAMDILVAKRTLGAKFVQSDFPNLMPGTHILINDNGYIDPYQAGLPLGFQFDLERDYLLPIPQQELTLNKEKLIQNPGWNQ